MPYPRPPPTAETVVVTTTGTLRAIIADEVDRAVRRAVASLVEGVGRDDEWITPRVAQKVYGRHRSTLHRWSRDGLLAARKVGGSVYYSRHAVAQLTGSQAARV